MVGAPLISFELGFDTRTFAFCNGAAQSSDQGLNLTEGDRGKRWTREDSGEGSALLRVHN